MAEFFQGLADSMSASIRHYFQTVLSPDVAPAVLFGAAVIALLGILFLLIFRKGHSAQEEYTYQPHAGVGVERLEQLLLELQKRVNAMNDKGNNLQHDFTEVREALRAFGESYRDKYRQSAEQFAHLSNELRGIKLVLKGIVRSSLERYTAELRSEQLEADGEEEGTQEEPLQAAAGERRNSSAMRASGSIRASGAVRQSGAVRVARDTGKGGSGMTGRRVVLERSKRSSNEVFFKE